MQRFGLIVLALLMLVSAVAIAADEKPAMPPMPTPQKEHELLAQFAGEWDCEATCHMPGSEPVKNKGTESAKMIGGFWLQGTINGEMMGKPMTGVLTLGFDAQNKQYVGTWIDSMTGKLWTYTGEMDPSGKALTLSCEGPCPMTGKVTQFKEVLELTDKDHKTFTSTVKGEDGKWATMMTATYARKK